MIQRHFCTSIDQLTVKFTNFSVSALQNSLNDNQVASLVIPGGNTPRHYLPSLACQSLRWRDVSITLSDERWVEPNAETSNERLVTEHFLNHMPEAARFVRLKTHHNSPFEAIDTVNKNLSSLPLPISLTVLGLGEDGHIASLFPGMEPNLESDRLCIAIGPPVAPSVRISLTLKALINSRNIAIVATGSAKRHLIDKLTEKLPDPQVPFVWLMQNSQAPITIFETDEI